jgi:hypothetical protein
MSEIVNCGSAARADRIICDASENITTQTTAETIRRLQRLFDGREGADSSGSGHDDMEFFFIWRSRFTVNT